MKKLAIVLVIVMLTTMISGCGGTSTTTPSEQTTTAESTAAESTAESTATESTAEQEVNLADHEIYELAVSTIYFDGVRPYTYESRADIPKALPIKKKGDKLYIGMPISRMSSELFVSYVELAKERCEQYGYKFEFTDAAGSTEKQRQDFDTFITKGVDVILINPLDPISNELDVQRAVEAGVAIMGFGIAFFPTAGVITCVGSDYYNSCYLLGQKAAKEFEGEQIRLGMIIGRYGQSMMESKANGFLAGLISERFNQLGKPFANKEDGMLYAYEKYLEFRDKGKLDIPEANVNIVASGEGLLTANNAMKVAEDMFTAQPDINLCYVCTYMEGEGVVQALNTLNIPYGNDQNLRLVFGTGASEWVKDLIMDGKLLACGHDTPAQVSYNLIDIVHDIYEGKISVEDANNLTITTYAPGLILDKDNILDYYEEGKYYLKSQACEMVVIDKWNAEHAK